MAKALMCKFGGVLIGWDLPAKRALLTRGNCDRWTCYECAKRMSDHWKLRADMGAKLILKRGERLDFATITSHEKLTSFEDTERVWRHAWGMLYNALKRQNPSLMYFIVPERHADGRMHVHALWNASVKKRWLKDNARKRGLGYMVDTSEVKTPRGAVLYVTKYIAKNLGTEVPPHFRRVRVSQNWPDIPAPNSAHSLLKWEFTRNEYVVNVWIKECQDKHIDMLDAKTAQAFDAGEIDYDMMY